MEQKRAGMKIKLTSEVTLKKRGQLMREGGPRKTRIEMALKSLREGFRIVGVGCD